MLVQSKEGGRRFCDVPDNVETTMGWGQMEIYIKSLISLSSGQTKRLPAVTSAPLGCIIACHVPVNCTCQAQESGVKTQDEQICISEIISGDLPGWYWSDMALVRRLE